MSSKKSDREELLKTLQGITGSMKEIESKNTELEQLEIINHVPNNVHDHVPNNISKRVPAKLVYNRQVHYKITQKQYDKIKSLAAKWGITESEVIRWLIDRAKA